MLVSLKLAIAPHIKNLLSLRAGQLMHKRVFLARQTERVSVIGASGNRLVGSLYHPTTERLRSSSGSPAILLLHGSTPAGRQMGLYRLLGHRLAALGYVVLALDQRGFGESDDPEQLMTAADLDFAGDALRALQYLCDEPSVDQSRVYLFGHSFGGDVAIAAAARANADIPAAIAFGPGRRYPERIQRELSYFCRRFTAYMGLRETIPGQLFVEAIAGQAIENHEAYYSRTGHTPLLLVDGEHEDRADRDFLRAVAVSLDGDIAYETLENADHYANVSYWGSLIVYDSVVVAQLIRMIDAWFQQEAERQTLSEAAKVGAPGE